MKVKDLKKVLEGSDDDLEVFIRNTVNPVGNIEALEEVEQSQYSFFGSEVDCLILRTHSSKTKE